MTGKESLKEESQKKYTSDAVTLMLPLTKCNPTMEQDNSPGSSCLFRSINKITHSTNILIFFRIKKHEQVKRCQVFFHTK